MTPITDLVWTKGFAMKTRTGWNLGNIDFYSRKRIIPISEYQNQMRTDDAFEAAGSRGFDHETVASPPDGMRLATPSILQELVEFSGVTLTLLETIEARDTMTRGHSERVAGLSRRLAQSAGCDAHMVDEATVCGLLHDVGKVGIPDRVLSKPGPLTDAEFGIMQRHPEIGERILGCLPALADIRTGVRSHHERWDGRGYPDGIAGESIPLLGRIVAIADAFDAMCSNRVYKLCTTQQVALKQIAAGSGSQFDPFLASCFLHIHKEESQATYRFPRGVLPERRSA
jgi:HD-GYP domain-containing protein (c-di-GMP phosphodiesterase class II)